MMKKLLSTLLLGFACIYGYSQYHYNPATLDASDPPPGNPGALQALGEFPLGGGLDPSWVSILGPSGTPTWSPTQTLPFAFDFNGSPVTQYKVSSSGVLTFSVGAATVPSGNNTNLPGADVPDNSVCVWGLSGPGGNDNIVVQTFGTAPNRQHWVFFASYNYEGGGASCWHYYSIVLEETSNKIYIVDQRHTPDPACVPSLTMGIQVNNTTVTEVAGSPSVPLGAGTGSGPEDNVYYEFIQGTRPNYNLSVISTDLATWLVTPNAPFTINAHIHNVGAQALIAYDFNYSVNGGAPVTGTVSGVNIQPLTGTDGSSPIAWNPPGSGTYDLKIWTSNLNGNADELPADDTVYKTVNVVNDFVPRVSLHEDFTSSSCPPCLPGGIQLRATLANFPDSAHTLLSYPMQWPSTGDPYHTQEADDRRNFYGVNAIPNLFVDGGWDGNPQSYDDNTFSSFQSIPSFMRINAGFSVDSLAPTLKEVKVDVSIDPIENYGSNNLYMFAMIYETLTFNNMSNDNPNGETEWHHYVKKMLPDANGTFVGPLTANTPVSFNLNYFFTGNYRLPANATVPIDVSTEHSVEEFSDLGVVVFVQDIATGEVMQSTYADVNCNDLIVAYDASPDNGTSNGSIKVLSVNGGVGYTYTFDGNPITNVDSIGGLSMGSHILVVTDAYGCSVTEEIEVPSNVSIEDLLQAGINVLSTYPNPNNGDFTINVELKNADDLVIELYDMHGRVVFTDSKESALNYQKTVSLSDNLPAGVYILKAQTSTGVGSERVMVK